MGLLWVWQMALLVTTCVASLIRVFMRTRARGSRGEGRSASACFCKSRRARRAADGIIRDMTRSDTMAVRPLRARRWSVCRTTRCRKQLDVSW